MFGLDYFDAVLLTGEYQAKDIRFLEQLRGLTEKKLVTVGCPYLDFFAEKISQIPKEENHQFTLLLSPSWGPSALLSRYGEKLLDPLSETGWRIIVRPHPQSRRSEKSMLESLEKRYKDIKNIEWDYDKDNIYSLVKADIMISDFSGIIYDFIFLRDKPVIYVNQDFDLRPYDAGDLDHELWQFTIIREIGIELREEHFNNIKELISGLAGKDDLRAARKKAKDTAWQYRGEAAKRTVDYMIDYVNNNSIKT
jgi:CDP-glycerol glycerophosphotransferase (TagB/SpsB family)